MISSHLASDTGTKSCSAWWERRGLVDEGGGYWGSLIGWQLASARMAAAAHAWHGASAVQQHAHSVGEPDRIACSSNCSSCSSS